VKADCATLGSVIEVEPRRSSADPVPARPVVERALVQSLTMLHHQPSPAVQDTAFAEIARVLRPGAVFVANDSPDSEDFGVSLVDDAAVPIDLVTLQGRLERTGFTSRGDDQRGRARGRRMGAPAMTGPG